MDAPLKIAVPLPGLVNVPNTVPPLYGSAGAEEKETNSISKLASPFSANVRPMLLEFTQHQATEIGRSYPRYFS